MRVITIVPDKCTFSTAQLETLVRIILAIFIRMRPVNKKEGRLTIWLKIPRSRIDIILPDPFLARTSLKFSSYNAFSNKMMIVFHKPLYRIFFNRIILG